MSAWKEIHSADKGSKTYDWLRCYGGLTVVVGLTLFTSSILAERPVDWFIAYCGSMGGLLALIAGSQAIRRDREEVPPGEAK